MNRSEEGENSKVIVRKKIGLKYIDGIRNYISSINDSTDGEYTILHSSGKKTDLKKLHQTKMDNFFIYIFYIYIYIKT